MTPPIQTDAVPQRASVFEEELDRAFGALRASVAGLFGSIRADPNKPQVLSRRLKINKNLAWKASRLVGASSPSVGIPHIPGVSGLDLLLGAFEGAGAAPEAIEAVREARRRFDEFINTHAGDRVSLDLMLDSMAGGWNSDRLEVSRRLAYQGNSGIWGIQTRVRLTMTVLAPSRDDPSRVDMALVGAYIDCRRLRRSVTWPIFKIKAQHDSGAEIPFFSGDSLDSAEMAVGATRLIPRFCSPNMPEIRAVRDRDDVTFELGDGPVGNTGTFDCVFGSLMPGLAPRYRTDTDSSGRIYSNISVPAERLLFDVMVHKDLPFADSPVVAVYSGLRDRFNPAAPQSLDHALPIQERLERFAPGTNAYADELVSGHAEIRACMMEAGGWDAADFTTLRLSMQYPPLPSFVVIEFPLPEPPRPAR